MPTRHATGSTNMASDEPGDVDVSGFADYERYDALGLAELVRRRRVSPGELLGAAIERVAARNPAINAVTMPLYDYGRAAIAAGLPDGPFTGVPFLMKDLTASIAGVKMTRSSRFFADAPPPAAGSEHVTRLKRAGLVIFGRTNTSELGLSLTCEPQLTELTRVLIPRGLLLLAFHGGEGEVHADDWFGRGVSIDATLYQPTEMATYMKRARLDVEAITTRAPYEFEYQTTRVYAAGVKR